MAQPPVVPVASCLCCHEPLPCLPAPGEFRHGEESSCADCADADQAIHLPGCPVAGSRPDDTCDCAEPPL